MTRSPPRFAATRCAPPDFSQSSGAPDDGALFWAKRQGDLEAPVLLIGEERRDRIGENGSLDEPHLASYAAGAVHATMERSLERRVLHFISVVVA